MTTYSMSRHTFKEGEMRVTDNGERCWVEGDEATNWLSSCHSTEHTPKSHLECALTAHMLVIKRALRTFSPVGHCLPLFVSEPFLSGMQTSSPLPLVLSCSQMR